MHVRKAVIAGGSGFLGKTLQAFLIERGWSVCVLTRNPQCEGDVLWDGRHLEDWYREIEGSDALINMAGRTVDCRYNDTNKAQILDSRLDTTRVLHKAIATCDAPPACWLNSSTATIYNDTRGDAPANTEAANNIGDDFSMGVARRWEEAFFEIDYPHVAQTALRTAIVMGNEGGAFPILHRIARFGLCSPQGSGNQWISWLHIKDFCRAVLFLLDNPVDGVVNVCAPNPIRNEDFNRLLKEHVRPWVTIPQPEWLLKLGAIFLRTETELVLKSRKVTPATLLEAGFQFEYQTAERLVEDLCRNSD